MTQSIRSINENETSLHSQETLPKSNCREKVYTYGEAINLAGKGTMSRSPWSSHFDIKVAGTWTFWKRYSEAGNGWYSIGLLSALSTNVLAMAIDMFGFSVVVSGATCDLNLDIKQTSILLSAPFLGPIAMSYPWGYVCDTQGRRKSLLIAMWVSFIVAALGAFSPNWTVMAVLKFLSTSFCSCAQSASYTLLGESCSETARDPYMLIMSSVLDFSLAVYVVAAYFILNLNFAFDWGFIIFTPWRLLALVLSIPLAMGAFAIHFYHESPKFLINVGREEEAVYCLREIWRRNNGKGDKYPAKKIVLNEVGNFREKDATLLRSLWNQIVPLFRPPLLWRSLQLYFFIAVVFSTNNSYFIWFPYLADKFTAGLNSNDTGMGFCHRVVDPVNNNSSGTSAPVCNSGMDASLIWSSLIQGSSFVFVMMIITKLAGWKKLLQIVILALSGLSSVGAGFIEDNLIGAIMFLGLLANELCIGIIYTYFIDLYPTSYRGMASCLSVMVARASALSGVSLLGAFIMTHCTAMFYVSGGLLLVAAFVSLFLPPDVRKDNTEKIL